MKDINTLSINCRYIERLTLKLWLMVYEAMPWVELKRHAARHGWQGTRLTRPMIIELLLRYERANAERRWISLVESGYFENPPA